MERDALMGKGVALGGCASLEGSSRGARSSSPSALELARRLSRLSQLAIGVRRGEMGARGLERTLTGSSELEGVLEVGRASFQPSRGAVRGARTSCEFIADRVDAGFSLSLNLAQCSLQHSRASAELTTSSHDLRRRP